MIIAALLALALTADPSAAPAPAAAPKPAAKSDFKDPNRIICRREELVGSHRPQKICMTKHEWDVAEEQSRSTLKDGGIQAVERPFDPANAAPTGGLVGGPR
ncbi:MAG: hypothetical protein JSR45_04845 [Proteobacteria bacterium]|nr:hypothetical protein [Pseudomonadota bacterium]